MPAANTNGSLLPHDANLGLIFSSKSKNIVRTVYRNTNLGRTLNMCINRIAGIPDVRNGNFACRGSPVRRVSYFAAGAHEHSFPVVPLIHLHSWKSSRLDSHGECAGCGYHLRLDNAVPYNTILYHTMPYHTMSSHTAPYHTIPYRTIQLPLPHRTIPHHTIPYHAIPYHNVT